MSFVVRRPASLHSLGYRAGTLTWADSAWPLALVIGISIAIRFSVALLISTPRYYRDEFLYAEISRSLSHLGPPTVLGQSVGLYSFLSSLLTAPVWLISNVHVAFHLAQAEATIAFALAALPARALARRAGLGPRAALAVAAATLLVPDGVFSGTLMTEPFAYPLFLATLVVAVDTLAEPTLRRQAGLIAMTALLCFARAQFAFLPVAVLAAACLGSERGLRRRAVTSQPLMLLAVLSGGAAVLALGPGRVASLYGGLMHDHLSGVALAQAGVLAFVVMALAGGWVIVPGAVVGLGSLREGDARQRSLAALSFTVVPALLAEAALFGAAEVVVVERYVFYAVPLLVIGFLVAARRQLLNRRLHLIAGAGLAVLSVALPAAGFFGVNTDQSPALFGLSGLESALGWAGKPAVITFLILTALAAAQLGRQQGARALAVVGALILAGTAAAASTAAVLKAQRTSIPLLGLKTPTTLVIFPTEKSSDVMKELFWNPLLDRVHVIGTDTDPRRYPAAPGSIAPDGRLRAGSRVLRGPVVIDGAARTVWLNGPGIERRGIRTIVADASDVRVTLVATGWQQGTLQLGLDGRFEVWMPPAGARREQLVLFLRAPVGSAQTLTFRCGGNTMRRHFGAVATRVALSFDPANRSCWFGLTGGAPVGPPDNLKSVDVVSARLTAQR